MLLLSNIEYSVTIVILSIISVGLTVCPETGGSAVQPASSPSCSLLAIPSVTHTSSNLYVLSGYSLIPVNFAVLLQMH